MPQPNTINPYAEIGTQIAPGLNSIIGAAPNNVDDLVNAVYGYISALYYYSPSNQVVIELKSIAYNAVNSYRSNLVLSGNALFNASQIPFIEMLIGASMNSNIATDSFLDRISDIEDNIGTSDLNVLDQTSLFLATTIGSSAYTYWQTQITLGGSSSWHNYLSSNAGQNYMNLLLWSTSAMNGSFAGYGSSPTGLVEPSTSMVSNNMISALIGALTVTAGKLMYNWIPRITKPIMGNASLMTQMNGGTITGATGGPHHTAARFVTIYPDQVYGFRNPHTGNWATGAYGYDQYLFGAIKSDPYFKTTD